MLGPALRDAAAGNVLGRFSVGWQLLTGVSLAARAAQATVPSAVIRKQFYCGESCGLWPA
jgi:hypothetical protein